MKRLLNIILFTAITVAATAQDQENTDTLSLLFIGDIMGHDSQINSAYDAKLNTYDYSSVFEKVSHIINGADIAIGNLEVTLAGKPFKGYPQFSSPDELAVACKNSGLDVLVTSNNHSSDRGGDGVIRTLDMLDSLGFKHTGTFRDKAERDSSNLLILQKGGIKLGLLNYTYGTNEYIRNSQALVNIIDTSIMSSDIEKSKSKNLDKLIVFLHWGSEYQSSPSKQQIDLSNFLFEKGVDIIIGAHPHVLQPMEYHPVDELNKERLIAYSLGNFVSNQRTVKRDGGAMLTLTLTKENGQTSITNKAYSLVWVNKPVVDGKIKFQLVPCLEYEQSDFNDMDANSIASMKVFINDSRKLYEKGNINVPEVIYNP